MQQMKSYSLLCDAPLKHTQSSDMDIGDSIVLVCFHRHVQACATSQLPSCRERCLPWYRLRYGPMAVAVCAVGPLWRSLGLPATPSPAGSF